MNRLKVCEIFQSINGEGTRAGQPAVFVRLVGCNLNCSYCDTKWANGPDAPCEEMTAREIHEKVSAYGIRCVTLTGGEPLLHKHVDELLSELCGDDKLSVEIETNGSADVSIADKMKNRPLLTMDYKLPSSGMEKAMRLENYALLRSEDTVKFVCGSRSDLEKAAEIIERYKLIGRCHVYLSPVFGGIDPKDMVSFMLERKLNGVNLQLQLHKFIWDPNEKGV